MKTLKLFIVVILVITMGSVSYAQNTGHSKMVMDKTEKVKVSGNCDLCKARIEKAAKIDGVSKADWNSKTKVLTLVYNPAKVKINDIQKKIADAGHDTPKYKAPEKVYNSLPACCKYR